MPDWRPAATRKLIRLRAETLGRIRDFFAARDVLEVETPLLAPATVTDSHIDSIPAEVNLAGRSRPFYLQTSPEYAMKRLLAAGAGPCYQICKSFRQGDAGSRHNPEFTMLEWYRPGFSLEQLMDEVEQLLHTFLPDTAVERLSYRRIFQQHLNIDSHQIGPDRLQQFTSELLPVDATDLDATDCLQLLLAQVIEPELPEYCFIYDYPAAQAALARVEIDSEGIPVARRFELYCRGMELANGYDEALDAAELRGRFEKDQRARKALGRPQPEIDEKFLAALEHGMPASSGVALGIDRLLMLLSGAESIGEVLAFPINTI